MTADTKPDPASFLHQAVSGRYGVMVQFAILVAGLGAGFVWLTDYMAERRQETDARIARIEKLVERLPDMERRIERIENAIWRGGYTAQ